MAFTYVQHAYSRGTGNSGYSLSCSLPTTPTAGNLIAVGIDFEDYSGSGRVPSLSIVDSNGYAYNLVSSPLSWVAGEFYAAVAWGIVPNNACGTFVISTTTSYTSTIEIAVNVYEFNTGGAPVSLDTYAANAGSGTSTITSPAVTPSGAGELLIAFGDPGNVAISAVNSPWTTADTLSNGFAVLAYDLLSTSGSTSANFSLSSGTNSYWGCIVAAFKVNVNSGSTPNTDRATFSVSRLTASGSASVSFPTLQLTSHVNMKSDVSGAFGFVQSNAFGCNPTTGYGSGALLNTPTKGNLIVIGVLFKNGTNMWPGAKITACGQACSFTPAQAYSVGASVGAIALAWCVVPANPSNSFTATFSTLGFAEAACYVCEFSVGGDYPYLDTGAAFGYVGSTINAPGITPSNIGELLIAFGSANQTINAPGSPWSDGGQGDVDGTRMSYSLSSGYGTTYPSMPLSMLGTWECVTAAFYLSGSPVSVYPNTVYMASSVSSLTASGSANAVIESVSSTFSPSALTSTGTANVSLSTLPIASVIEQVGGSISVGPQVSTVSATTSVAAVSVEADASAAASTLDIATSLGSRSATGDATANITTLTIRTSPGFVVGGVWDRDLLPEINGAVTTISRLHLTSVNTPSMMVLGTPTQTNLLKIGSITAVSI
jgi:hypothetical protein